MSRPTNGAAAGIDPVRLLSADGESSRAPRKRGPGPGRATTAEHLVGRAAMEAWGGAVRAVRKHFDPVDQEEELDLALALLSRAEEIGEGIRAGVRERVEREHAGRVAELDS